MCGGTRSSSAFVAALGLLAGAAFTVLSPPMLASKALVVLPPSVRRGGPGGQPARQRLATQVVIASSDPVLARCAAKC